MAEEGKGMSIRFSKDLKKSLEEMSEDLGISQNKIVILATQALVANYEDNDIKIFKNLIRLNPKVLQYLLEIEEELGDEKGGADYE